MRISIGVNRLSLLQNQFNKLRRTIVRSNFAGFCARDPEQNFSLSRAPIHPSSNPSTMPESDIAIHLTLKISGRRTGFGSPVMSLTSNNTSALGFCL